MVCQLVPGLSGLSFLVTQKVLDIVPTSGVGHNSDQISVGYFNYLCVTILLVCLTGRLPLYTESVVAGLVFDFLFLWSTDYHLVPWPSDCRGEVFIQAPAQLLCAQCVEQVLFLAIGLYCLSVENI